MANKTTGNDRMTDWTWRIRLIAILVGVGVMLAMTIFVGVLWNVAIPIGIAAYILVARLAAAWSGRNSN